MPPTIQITTDRREQMIDITDPVQAAVGDAGITDGIVHLWSMHTTCGLTVNEGADPDVARDIVAHLALLTPRDAGFRHAEGNSDSHIKTLMAGPGLTLIVEGGRLVLGTWQRAFLCEWDGPRTRTIALRVMSAR